MNSLLVKLLGSILKFFLRLLILVVTGEWVDLEKFGKSVRPAELGRPSVNTQTPDRATLVRRIEELRAKQPGETQQDRAHFETFARTFGDSLEQHLREQGVGVRKRSFVALTRVDAADESALREVRDHTRYWPFLLQAAEGTTLNAYLTAVRERSRALAEDAPGLLHKLRREHGWPAYLRVSGLEQPALLRGAFGVWLAPLLAEILVTLQLGPGYAYWLLRGLDLSPVLRRPPVNNFLSDELPPLLRLYAALGTLEFLGYFEDAERIEAAVTKRLGAEPELVLSASGAVPGARPPTLPHELWHSELEGTLGSILEEAQPAFGGGTLLDAPGIAFLHGEHARALKLAAVLGQAAGFLGSRADPLASATEHREAGARDWLAAALLAWVQGNLREEEIVRRLRRALGGASVTRGTSSVQAVQPGTQEVSAGRALRTMLRDPRAIRDAVALGTALGPRATFCSRANPPASTPPGRGARRPLG